MEPKRVIRSAGVVGSWIMVSRLFGMLRDMVMASVFGGSAGMDAFVVAFTIPNLFRSLFGEGALSAAFVPVFADTRAREGGSGAWPFAARVFAMLSVTLLTLTLLGLLVVSLALRWLPLSERLLLIGRLLRIMLPYMLFICLAAFFSSILNALRRFALPAAIPVVLNLVMLAALLAVCPRLSPSGDSRMRFLAWSVLLAGVLQAAMPLPALWRMGFRPRLEFNWRDARIKQMLRLMAAAAAGVGVTQFNVLMDRLIAVWVGEGSPSYLYLAERLVYLPLGVFATALGTVLLPTLSIQVAKGMDGDARATIDAAMRQIVFIAAPAALGLLVLAQPIVRVLYRHGDFDAHAALMTARALACYAPGLVMFSLLKVLVPVFHARQDMRTPVKVGMVCSLLNLALSLVLMWPLRHLGIALATVVAAAVHVGMLAVTARRRTGAPDWRAFAGFVLRLILPLALLAASAVWSRQRLAVILHSAGWSDLPASVAALIAAIAVGAAVYLAAARLVRCRELNEIMAAVSSR